MKSKFERVYMSDRTGIFAGDDPIELIRIWLSHAEESELNDPNAIALSTVDSSGMPNVRVVLLKEITAKGFIFYTNFNSQKAKELTFAKKAAFVLYWKSLRRQIRVRGIITDVDDVKKDAYFASRSVDSRIGAWASNQSHPLVNRMQLENEVTKMRQEHGDEPKRPGYWGGYCLEPEEIEFWANGKNRLHDRFLWKKTVDKYGWSINRLYP